MSWNFPLGRLSADDYEELPQRAPRLETKDPIPAFVVAVRIEGEPAALARAFGARPPTRCSIFAAPGWQGVELDGVTLTRLPDEEIADLAPAPVLTWSLAAQLSQKRGKPVTDDAQIQRRVPILRTLVKDGVDWMESEGIEESPFAELDQWAPFWRFLAHLGLDALALPVLNVAHALGSDADDAALEASMAKHAIVPWDSLGAPLDVIAAEQEAQAKAEAEARRAEQARLAKPVRGTPSQLGIAIYELEPGPYPTEGTIRFGEREAVAWSAGYWPWGLPSEIWIGVARPRRGVLVDDEVELTIGAVEALQRRQPPSAVLEKMIEQARRSPGATDPVTGFCDMSHADYDRRARAFRALCRRLGPGVRNLAGMPDPAASIAANVAVRVLRLRPDLAALAMNKVWPHKRHGGDAVKLSMLAPYASGAAGLCAVEQGIEELVTSLLGAAS